MKWYRDPNQGQLFVGEVLRDEGIAGIAANNQGFIDEVIRVIQWLNRIGGLYTVNEIRSMVKTEPTHPNAWGAALRIAYSLGLYQIVGQELSRRPPAHARSIRIYARPA